MVVEVAVGSEDLPGIVDELGVAGGVGPEEVKCSRR